MNHRPVRTKTAKANSNLKDRDVLAAHDAARLESERVEFDRARAAFLRRRRKLVTKSVIAKAVPVFQDAEAAFEQSLTTTIGRAEAMTQTKQKLRRGVDRVLGRDLAGFHEIKSARQEYSRVLDSIVNAQLDARLASPVKVVLGDQVDAGVVPIEQYEPPFGLYDVETVDIDNFLTFNDSFADPASGVVMNNIRFHHDEHGWGTYNPGLFAYIRPLVGVTHRASRAGSYVNVAVVMQNLFNDVEMRVTDNFGFSSADLYVHHNLIVYVVQGTSVAPFAKPVYTTGLISHGSELSGYGPDVPQSGRYTFSVHAENVVAADEEIRVFAASDIHIFSDLDDMESYVNAMIAWQVQKLYVWVSD